MQTPFKMLGGLVPSTKIQTPCKMLMLDPSTKIQTPFKMLMRLAVNVDLAVALDVTVAVTVINLKL